MILHFPKTRQPKLNINCITESNQIYALVSTCMQRKHFITESDVNRRLAKPLNVIDWLTIIWKPDQSNKIKQGFFQAVAETILLYECTILTLTKHIKKKSGRNYTRILPSVLLSWKNFETPTTQNRSSITTCLLSQKAFKKTSKIWNGIGGEGSIHERCSLMEITETYIHKLCADRVCRLEDLPRAMDDKNKLEKSVCELYAVMIYISCVCVCAFIL